MKTKRLSSLIIMLILIFSLNVYVFAGDLNGIGSEAEVESIEVESPVVTTPIQEEQITNSNTQINNTDEDKIEKSTKTAAAVGDMFGNAGIDEKSIQEANSFIRPFATIANKIMAGILGVTSILMMFVTVLDLVYIGVPITRDLLDGGAQGSQQAQQGGRSMGGMGGMGGGYGGGGYGSSMGMGGGGRQQQQVPGGGLSAVGRFISDEAQAAVLDAQGGPMGASSMGGSVKTVIGAYIKKRSFFLIMFGVCVVLFTSTVFTDLGIKLGMWLLRLLMGIG